MPLNSRGRWAALLVIVLMAVWSSGCTTSAPAAKSAPAARAAAAPETANAAPLRVGISPDLPPLIYRQGDKITGLEAEFARELAQYLGRPLSFVELAWPDQIEALQEDRIDIIMSGMSITEMRRVRVAFCNPYAQSGLMALIRREDIQRFDSGYYALVERPTLGAVKNTTGEIYVRTGYPNAEKRYFDNVADAVEALKSRQIEVLIHDAPVIMLMAADNESQLTMAGSLLTKEYLAWAVSKDNTALRDKANTFLKDLKKQGRLQTLVSRWIPLANAGQ